MNLLELFNYVFSNISLTTLDIVAIALLLIHFGVPLLYYYYMKKRWLHAPWNIKTDPNYKPKITIIIPTYNEAQFIEKKLDNIYHQDYPRDKLEVIVVDSASTDGTPQLVKQWKQKHLDLNLKLIEESARRGKAEALNKALKCTTGEIVITTDVDALWLSKNTINETSKWFVDQIIGAVSCLKQPIGKGTAGIEEGYRKYYNILRLAESKAWSTPIFHGELAAFRKELLNKLGGFPTDIGADDSHTATRITLMGYRVIMPENILCREAIPRNGYHTWRIRRAQHLVQHFLKTLIIRPKIPRPYKSIFYMEVFLHLINPWILLGITLLFLILIAMKSPLAAVVLMLGIALLIYRPYRTWITTQLYLIVAMIRNLYTKDLVWTKMWKQLEYRSRRRISLVILVLP